MDIKSHLVGANGIGKTTLIKEYFMELIPSLGGSVELGENLEIGYFEQEIKGENRNTCIDEIWEEFPSFSQYEVRSALAKCGLTIQTYRKPCPRVERWRAGKSKTLQIDQ